MFLEVAARKINNRTIHLQFHLNFNNSVELVALNFEVSIKISKYL